MKLTGESLRMIMRRDPFRMCFQQCSNVCGERTSLIGRDFITPENFTSTELKKLMWTAADLKASQIKGNLQNCNATLIMNRPNILSQVVITNAMHKLGCLTNIITDDHWEMSMNIKDLGRSLSKLTNMIVTVDCRHECVEALSDGASVPVINFSSTSFQLIHCLATLLSVQEHYGFLRLLKIGWIGPCNAALNTYLYLSPNFEMKMQFTCAEDSIEDSREFLKCAMQYAILNGIEIEQRLSLQDAVYRAHVIVTSMHSCPNLQITQKILSEAAVNWTFNHTLPRSEAEVSDDVFYSKNSLVWKYCENLMWVFMAVATEVLTDYRPVCERPDFEGCEVPPQKFYIR